MSGEIDFDGDATVDSDLDTAPQVYLQELDQFTKDDLLTIQANCKLTGPEIEFIERVLDEGIPDSGVAREAELRRIEQIKLAHLFS